ncbi:PREDICTED: translation initiation factor IF-2-like [Chinchilla lanigera]|uniref:translation initiation factor IF-2-like n=1 Tax=Chinchilla lanigera TaxID=34839 RepID=UPI0006980FDC|nr:PREDICTED: translation initiation factor IF-2-like [Chinchilla lanigera]
MARTRRLAAAPGIARSRPTRPGHHGCLASRTRARHAPSPCPTSRPGKFGRLGLSGRGGHAASPRQRGAHGSPGLPPASGAELAAGGSGKLVCEPRDRQSPTAGLLKLCRWGRRVPFPARRGAGAFTRVDPGTRLPGRLCPVEPGRKGRAWSSGGETAVGCSIHLGGGPPPPRKDVAHKEPAAVPGKWLSRPSRGPLARLPDGGALFSAPVTLSWDPPRRARPHRLGPGPPPGVSAGRRVLSHSPRTSRDVSLSLRLPAQLSLPEVRSLLALAPRGGGGCESLPVALDRFQWNLINAPWRGGLGRRGPGQRSRERLRFCSFYRKIFSVVAEF